MNKLVLSPLNQSTISDITMMIKQDNTVCEVKLGQPEVHDNWILWQVTKI